MTLKPAEKRVPLGKPLNTSDTDLDMLALVTPGLLPNGYC